MKIKGEIEDLKIKNCLKKRIRKEKTTRLKKKERSLK